MKNKANAYPDKLMCIFAHEVLLQKARNGLFRNDRRAQMGLYKCNVWKPDYMDCITFYDLIYSPENSN